MKYIMDTRPVKAVSKVRFHCSLCGECCRHVKESVPLNPLDVYNLARYYRTVSSGIRSTEDILEQFTDVLMIGESIPYPVVLLKTAGADDVCVFLHDNRCRIQDAKPTTCRLYPFSVEPHIGSFQYFLCNEKPHHFTGDKIIRAGDWLHQNFTKTDREFLLAEAQMIVEVAPFLKKLADIENFVMIMALHWKFIAFDLDQPFLPQYRRNHIKLMRDLRDIRG